MANNKKLGLPGGPNEYVTHVSDLFSTEGYKRNSPDVNNPFNIIPSGNITMEGVDFPVMGTDNLGNSQMMTPGNNYEFPGDQVFEVPIAQAGGSMKYINEDGELERYTYPSSVFKDEEGNPSQMVMLDPVVINAKGPIALAKEQMKKYGITDTLKQGYVKDKSEKAYNNIVPQGYGNIKTNLDRYRRFKGNLGRDPEALWYDGSKDNKTYYTIPNREDAFRLYLGMPQINNSFSVSNYRPGESEDKNMVYLKPTYFQNPEIKQALIDSYFSEIKKDQGKRRIGNERLLSRGEWQGDGTQFPDADNSLGDFTFDIGQDENGSYISIYDIWDLNPFDSKGKGSSVNKTGKALLDMFNKTVGKKATSESEVSEIFGAGKPFEIYDRIYFDPETKKIKEMKKGGSVTGGGLLDKTMKCNSCSWEWKAADGGSDIDTCHKCGSKALPKAQNAGEPKIYNKPIEQEEGIVASIDNFITPIIRSLTNREAGTRKDIDLRIPPGEMKYFRNNEKPVNSNYIIGGDYMEDTPTAYKASEYPNTMYTTQGQTQEIDFETQQFYGIVDGNIKLGKKADFKDDDVIVPLRPNFGGNFSIKERESLDPEFIEKARKFNEVTNEIRESAYFNPEQKVWEEMNGLNFVEKYLPPFGGYEIISEYKDIIDQLDKKFGKGSYMYDLEPMLNDYNSNGYDVLNPAGNQLDTFGNKVVLFDPESNEHLFISNSKVGERNKKIIDFKKKYPNANYLNLDNGRFSSYMVNKDGITSDDATEYMQNSFKGTDATGYNFAYKEGGFLPKAQFGLPDWLSSGADYVMDTVNNVADSVKDGYNVVVDNAEDILTDVKTSLNPYNFSQTKKGDNPLNAFLSGDFKKIPTYEGANKDEAFKKARKKLGPGQEFLYDGVRYGTDFKGETTHKGTNNFFNRMNKGIEKGQITNEQFERFKEVWNELGQPKLEVGEDKYDNILTGKSWAELGLDKSDHVNPFTGSVFIARPSYYADNYMEQVLNEFTHVKQQNDVGRVDYTLQYLKDLAGSGIEEVNNFINETKLNLDNEKGIKFGSFNLDNIQENLYDTPGTLENHAHRSDNNLKDSYINYVIDGQKLRYGGDLPKAQTGGTLTVESKDDPRYQAYQDSLSLYNNYKDLKSSLAKNEYIPEGASQDGLSWTNYKKNVINQQAFSQFSPTLKSTDDFIRGIINPNLPNQLFSNTIDPIGIEHFRFLPTDHDFPSSGDVVGLTLKEIFGFTDEEREKERQIHKDELNAWNRTNELYGDVRVVANYSNVKPRREVIAKEIPTNGVDMIYNRIIKQPLSQLDSYGIEPFKPDLESLISGDIEAQPIYQHKPYNQNDKPVSLGLLQKMGIENPESQGFHYIKDSNGNFKTMQTREAYRKNNLRPNNTEYKNGGWLDKYQDEALPKAQYGIPSAAKLIKSGLQQGVKHSDEIISALKGFLKNADEPIYRGVYLNDEIRNLAKFTGKTDDEILEIMGTQIPGNTGTIRKRQFNQTLNFGRDFDQAAEHIRKFTNPNSIYTIGNTDDLLNGQKYVLKVKPNSDLNFISAEQQNNLYRETIEKFRTGNPNGGFVVPTKAKDFNYQNYYDAGYVRPLGLDMPIRSEGTNVIQGNFPQFFGNEGDVIGRLLKSMPIKKTGGSLPQAQNAGEDVQVDTDTPIGPYKWDSETGVDLGILKESSKGRGQRIANIAMAMAANGEDGGRPPASFDNIESVGSFKRYLTDAFNSSIDEDGLCRDNTCVQTVKDFYRNAGIDAIPEDVYNNREFLKNFKEYGFVEILDHKNIQPGDAIQYYYNEDTEDIDVNQDLLNFPYHIGLNVSPGKYIGDGRGDAPIQIQDMYIGTSDEKGEYKKDPFRAFRYIKQNKEGGSLPKAQNAGEDVQNAQQDVQNRAVIFVESPTYDTYQYDIDTPIYDSEGNLIANYPSELETLYNNYNQSQTNIEDIKNKKIAEKKANGYLQFLIHEKDKMKRQHDAMYKEFEENGYYEGLENESRLVEFQEKYQNLGDQIGQFTDQIYNRDSKIDKRYDSQLLPLYKTGDNAFNDFYNSEFNSAITSTDSTFYKEAQNLQKVYERLYPDTNVEIVPTYDNPDTMREKVADLNKNDAMFIFGHSGGMLGGIPNTEIADIFQESKAENCYLGSCDFEDEVGPYTNMVNKNVNYRPSGAWWGVNPNGSTIDEAMWSRVTDPTTGNIDPILQTSNRTAKIITPTLGVDYQTKKLKKGGGIEKYTMYKDYVNGIYTGDKKESKAQKNYDRLNRLHYREAKTNQMTPANYILTYLME